VQSLAESMLALYRSLTAQGVPGGPASANGNGQWSVAQGDDGTVSSAP
jgi:hypothetical protein